MLLNYIRLTIRTFFKNKTAFIINLLGMSIALGCSITAFVNYQYNTEFDTDQKNAGDLYRIGFWQVTEKRDVPYGVCPIPVANLIRQNVQEGDEVIQYISKQGQFRVGTEMFGREFIYTDPAFTKAFSFNLLSGTNSLTDKRNLLISDKLATTYFGTTDVVGKELTQIISGEPREFTISGVYKAFPANSSFRFDLITSYDNYFIDPAQRASQENDWARWATTFLYLKNKGSIDVITKQLQGYVKTQNEARPDLQANKFYVEPFIGMSARAVRERNQGHWLNSSMPPAAVIAPFVMAGFVLLVACFNFMNNAIAIAGNRLKEIGIRKVIGGRRKELIFQFLTETMVFCILSTGVGLVLAEYFTAGWNSMWAGLEMSVHYQDNIPLVLAIGVLTLMTALFSGSYPAFYISSFRPIQILQGTTRFGGTTFFTKSLLVVQFSISLAAVIFAIAFYYNSKFQKEYDLGYAWRSVIQVPLEKPEQFELLKNELASNPHIHSVGGSEHHIYASSYTAAARSGKQKEKEIDMLNVGDDYFKTVNVRIVAGRGFQKDQASDMNESIIVNEEFVRAFALGADPIGQRIMLNDTLPVYVIGVAKDVYLGALFQPLSPVAFRYAAGSDYRYLTASTDPDQLVAVNGQIKESWKKLFPNVLYNGELMEHDMSMALEHFDAVVILYTFLGIVAIIMSVSGLYSLVSLNLHKRTKELGIRKILGAPLMHMLMQASKLFLIIMMVSFVTGSMLGYFLVNFMMNNVWEYYESVDVKVLTLAVSILFTIAVATIGFKVKKVTAVNPVDSLRYE